MQKMSKTPEATIVMVPAFRAVSSGYQEMGSLFMDGGFFQKVKPFELPLNNIMFNSADFLLYSDGKFNWLWSVQDSVTVKDVNSYEIIDFPGGLYATATTIDSDMESRDAVIERMKAWLETSGFAIDDSRNHQQMSQMIYCLDEIKEELGYEQLQIYLPIKKRI
ncbi:hypothetical protein acsn021_17330 [Anaerocolumna cellulosilytica]|uniref:Uncharacterized protein n=1 Tax=Anaerocolumna cellulosilytica TaxID=433286 RepID=A0A6S6QU51_9FIRM|nr:GyrI-like domain-containing protein [Anaerocolumna cellulosilytica]MBB5194873.1 hypothetical protein [Anaerocolumna cellulosilytica]BCJ94164.1 hypothetical protein acsn021_17330 [Anaerocolumna cellulosilytica]